MRKRIFVISWFFPPINSSEGLVTFKLLNNSKFEYDVYTQHNNDSWSYGQSDDLILKENVHRIDSEACSLEDFHSKAIEYFKKNASLYDIVMTRSMPEMSHIIGLDIKKIRNDIIWIASFGDPIGNNPFTLISLKEKNPYSLDRRYERPMSFKEIVSPIRIFRSIRFKRSRNKEYKMYIESNNILQNRIIDKCDYYICNSVNQKNYMLKGTMNLEVLEEKKIILPHSFDESLYTNKKHKNQKITFTYVGHLDDIRTPHQLFLALKRLSDFDDSLAEKVQFNFYGNMSDNEKLYLLNNDLLEIVRIRKPVKYLKSLEIMEEADWLIHIDANISEIVDNNIFFAAKLADYIGANKKIFGITMIDGISADILREYNSLAVENEQDEIFNYLYLIIYEGYDKKIDKNCRDKFNAKAVAQEFDDMIDRIYRRSNKNE